MQEFTIKQTILDYRSKEAFKTLRTNIEFSGEDTKVIFLTSTTPNEGKSTVSFELAQSFAQNGMKTLLIDADLRKSVMKSRGKKGKVKYGLTHYLSGKTTFENALCASDVDNFYMIFAGPVPPNPSELLGNDRFKNMIEASRKMFDIVIVDTPPIGSVIDAAVVSKFCDGGILVIGCGDISYRYARKSKEQLELAGCKILGCVLNKVNFSSNSYYGKTYGFDSTKNMEAQFSDILDAINMKDFKDAPYSLAAINAYFHLKNMEVARVVTALECIRYGYKPEAISQYINQKRGVL